MVRPITRFFRLPATDRSLLLRSLTLVTAARLALWVLPFNVARGFVAKRTARRALSVRPQVERIGWAVSLANRLVPRGTCLTQALAAEALLLRSGYPAEFRIGVVKTGENRLEAHAWVESSGHLVVGELTQGLSAYSPLPPLPGATS
jgi:hypothetical protein